jgi:hypothetical protein
LKNYDRVIAAVKNLGTWAHVQKSLWYISTSMTSEMAAAHVWAAMDGDDSLIVVDASNNDAYWYNLKPDVGPFLQSHWRKMAA